MAQTSSPCHSARSSHRDEIEACLARIGDPEGEGERTFLTVWDGQARGAADGLDALGRAGYVTPLDGMPVSIKDLLDVQGETTRAGARALNDAAPAPADAPVVARLKSAGALLLGRTNMTPFAYSVVGLNAHHGTPANPADNARTPGGSSSGAAVSVAAGMVCAAIGSDTVGSIRVPAALCGIVGFKPSQRSVPRGGTIPLSSTLDSIGPLARSVEDCARVQAVIAGEPPVPWHRTDVSGLRLALPGRSAVDGLDATVARAFERACRKLGLAGAGLRTRSSAVLDALADNALMRTIQSVEAFAWHEDLLASRGTDYDPRIRDRILRGREIRAADYARALGRRAALIAAFFDETADADALMLPTVPVVAPTFAACEADEDAVRTRLLRNTASFNVLDACAISLPIHHPGELPVGLMLAAPSGNDARLLDIAHVVEAALRA